MQMIEESRRSRSERFKNLLYIFVGAILLVLACPPYDFYYLAYFAISLPLTTTFSSKDSFKNGFIFGFIYNVFSMYWISFVLKNYGDLNSFVSITLMLLLCAYLAIYYAIFFKIFENLQRRLSVVTLPFTLSLVFITLEYIRAKILTGFPWMLLGYSQHSFIKLIQIAEILGVYGVSFIVIFFNISISLLLTTRRSKACLINIFLFLLFIISAIFYGNYRISRISNIIKEGKTLTVSVIQGNIDQSKKWEKSLQREIIKKYIKLTEKEQKNKPHIVIWPETALPFIYGNDMDLTVFLKTYLSDKDFYLYTGFPHYDFGDDGKLYLTNSAGIFYKGELIGKYNKTHLVPFGEYVPLKKILFFVNKLVTAAGDFLPGKNLNLLNTKDIKIASLICYEAIFPEISAQYKKMGANVLINITNDAWFGKSSAPYQHFAMSKFRAIENSMFLIRAANTGISGVISPTGEVLISTPLFKDDSFSFKISY